MKNNKVSVYLASGWFTPRTVEILNNLEHSLTDHPNVDLYSPRRDGVKLDPGKLHDPALRSNVFHDNIDHILAADFVLANIDSYDSYNDTGTVYEIGYAMAHDIPVVGFTLSDNLEERFGSILSGFSCIITSYEDLEYYISHEEFKHFIDSNEVKDKVLLVGNGDYEVDKKLAAYIAESGMNLRWISDTKHSVIYRDIEDIFKGVDYMVAVIDDRKTLVSWMIGQAYARNIPIVTYSNNDYDVNLMLLVSLRIHLKGDEELVAFLQRVKREGIDSLPKFDNSKIKAM